MKRKLKLPYGFQDFLPDECYNKELLETNLSQIYRGYGYARVETPTIEYYDTFHDVSEPEKLKKMFKLTDNDGSLLALRPDTTLQICRMGAKLDLNYPQKLYYIENSFEYQDSSDTARTREFSQIGVELLGDSGREGDLEIITLAIESFLKAGLDDFIIEIGNNNFFKGLISESGLNDKDINTLTALINRKDMLGLEMFLQKKKTPDEFSRKLLLLPSLFGKKEVFARAAVMTDKKIAKEAIARTKYVYEALEKMGYAKYVSVDMGMLHGLNYYSGLVLKGYSRNLGLCLLDGGRYDDLCSSFGYSLCAVGFAIGAKRLLMALDENSKLRKLPPCDCAYCAINADAGFEAEYLRKLRNKGLKVTKVFCNSKEKMIEYCKEHNITEFFIITESGVEKFAEEAICNK